MRAVKAKKQYPTIAEFESFGGGVQSWTISLVRDRRVQDLVVLQNIGRYVELED